MKIKTTCEGAGCFFFIEKGRSSLEASTNMGLTGDYWGIFWLFVLVIAFSAQCALFSKAGLPWERAFVPVYGVWSFFRLADSTLIFFLAPGVQLLLGLTGLLAYDIVQIIFTLLLIILYGVFCTRLARAFGKGKGFALGRILLYPVF